MAVVEVRGMIVEDLLDIRVIRDKYTRLLRLSLGKLKGIGRVSKQNQGCLVVIGGNND